MSSRDKVIQGFVVSGKRAGLALLAAVFLAGCASVQPQKNEDIVAQRATARWAALLAGDFERAYHFASPSYRAAVTATAYRAKFGRAVRWLDAQVGSVTCTEEVCEVRVRLKSEVVLGAVKSGAPIQTEVVEKWIRETGDWWNFQSL